MLIRLLFTISSVNKTSFLYIELTVAETNNSYKFRNRNMRFLYTTIHFHLTATRDLCPSGVFVFCIPDTTWPIKTLCDVCQFTMKVLRTATPPAHRGEGSRAPISLPVPVRWAAEPSLCLVVSAARPEIIHLNWNKYFCTARVRPPIQNFETLNSFVDHHAIVIYVTVSCSVNCNFFFFAMKSMYVFMPRRKFSFWSSFTVLFYFACFK